MKIKFTLIKCIRRAKRDMAAFIEFSGETTIHHNNSYLKIAYDIHDITIDAEIIEREIVFSGHVINTMSKLFSDHKILDL